MKVLIVDDHPLIRQGIKQALHHRGIEVVAEAASVAEALAQIAHANPDLVLIDLHLPDGSGLEIITWVRRISSSMRLVVLTLHDDDRQLIASLEAGANGYLLKTTPIHELIASLEMVDLSPTNFLAAGLHKALIKRSRGFDLSPREIEILNQLRDGSTNREISGALFLSQATVKSHLNSIYRKLGVTNRTAALEKGRREGLVQ